MKTISCKTIFWSLFFLSSIAAALFSFHYFSRAFPIVNLDIRMSRSSALQQAAILAQQFNLGPSEYRQAAMFATDSTVQTYVELGAGGADAYNMMVTGSLYSPYTWQVRHVKPFETHELIVKFKPDGTPYGFVETIAEEIPGASLSPEQAEVIARQQANSFLNINFDEYTQVETSKETRPNGRIDHTFVYERPNIKIGKAFYRLRLVVSGEKLTELTHSVKVPEEFIHHYQEMRSANNTVAHAAQLAMMLLYILGIGLVGLYFLSRKKYIIWKTPLIWGFITAILTACASLSNFPLLWFNYITTMPVHTFIVQCLFLIVLGFVFTLTFNTTIFMIAESLTRLALSHQGQLWKAWTLHSGSSWQVLGRTLAAYLLVPLCFADVIIFYRITMRYFGWWTPACQLTDPNILACYFPWVNAVAPALSAGFLEECLFRAFPLAAAILLGRRYGKQNWWIAAAFIIQILIFGAAHANYATEPAYARLVELVIFSTLMGIVYLKFGLLIGIISHAVYDLVWFALPIFISCAPYAWINKLFIILIGLVPLVTIIVRRMQNGCWHELPYSDYNSSWQAVPTGEPQPKRSEQYTQIRIFSPLFTYSIIGAGIAGFAVWLLCTRFSADVPALTINRQDAIQKSRQELAKHSIKLGNTWTVLSNVLSFNSPTLTHQLPGASSTDQHRFIWQKGGQALYNALLGTYLQPPHWAIRFMRFDGSVKDRAEEYFVSLADSTILRIQHTLPEELHGKQLSENEARMVAQQALRDIYQREPETFKEISALSSKQPERLDWNFTFADNKNFPINEGQARILITIAGNGLADHCRYVHVPEEWVRSQDTDRAIFGLIHLVCYNLFFALAFIAFLVLFRRFRLYTSQVYATALFGAIITLLILKFANMWPALMATLLNAQEPYLHQIFRLLGSMALSWIFMAALYTFIIIFLTTLTRSLGNINGTGKALLGIAIGLCWGALISILKKYGPALEPLWGNITSFGAHIPTVAVILDAIFTFIIYTITILLMIHSLNMFNKTKKGDAFQILIMIVLGFIIMGTQPILTLQYWVFSGFVVGLFLIISYFSLLAYIPAATPWVIGTALILDLSQQAMFKMYPMAMLSNFSACIVILIAAWFWYNVMSIYLSEKAS